MSNPYLLNEMCLNQKYADEHNPRHIKLLKYQLSQLNRSTKIRLCLICIIWSAFDSYYSGGGYHEAIKQYLE